MNFVKIKCMNAGQAVLEYVLILLFVAVVATQIVSNLSETTGSRFGSLAHSLSLNLSTGVCERDCFFQGYLNGQNR